MREKLETHSEMFSDVHKRNHAYNSKMMLEDKHNFKFNGVITCRNTSYYSLLIKMIKSYPMKIEEKKEKVGDLIILRNA